LTDDRVEVAIVGAGISGLSAAYELSRRQRSFIVLEARDKPGGIVQTERVDEFLIDKGPDALLVQKPAALELCGELGLTERLIPTSTPRTAFVLRKGTLHPLPGGSVLGFPTRLKPLFRSRLFSMPAKVRMAAELVVRKRRESGDESIAAFVRRRFGAEAVTYIAEPLLAGIHAGDVDRLSMRALFPRLIEAESRAGSVIRAFRGDRGIPSPDGPFRSFPNGLGELVDGLVAAVPSESLRCRSKVVRIDEQDGFTIHFEKDPPARARALILAIPGFAIAGLLQPIDAHLSAECASIQYLSTATVVFAFPRDAIGHNLQGTGFVVPRTEGMSITAGAWISSKWPYRAPQGQALLRAFLGGARDPRVLARSDQELINAALDDLTRILDIHGLPTFAKVYRWHRASPQQEVGHAERMRQIEAGLARHPGLFVSAAGFRGVGIPDCIADARATARAALAFVLNYQP
jgi:oxygen-dependent protoporphyrinogen oxidase